MHMWVHVQSLVLLHMLQLCNILRCMSFQFVHKLCDRKGKTQNLQLKGYMEKMHTRENVKVAIKLSKGSFTDILTDYQKGEIGLEFEK